MGDVKRGGARGCPLYCDATQTVFGEGPKDAPVILVGEQPGNDKDIRAVRSSGQQEDFWIGRWPKPCSSGGGFTSPTLSKISSS